jgi:hypothetical protein
VTRLTDAREAVEHLEAELDDLTVPAQLFADLRTMDAALGRMAQLEKVAELARALVADPGADPLLLNLAVTELDNHPDTREPGVVVTLEAIPRSPAAEEAARRAWDSWRGQRGPGVTEAP